ncbi:MAG: NHLP family bacteriocin export ABC transporter peptidase/permease/ATPase subunit [Rhodospirillales bacterium]|nr:NHLP family bacteriocin export ABC transporter peptidase/permease/ATPase subunit [Rhodospirillales bacterium]
MSQPTILRANLGRRRGGRRRTPSILQMESTECGAACLGMILARYGRWVPLEELRQRCGVSRDGSKASNMLRAAREYGLLAQGFRRDPKRVFDVPFPMIVFWNFNHFVVLEGIRGRRVYINDPAEGPRRISWQEFDENFTGVCLGFEPGPAFRRHGRPTGVWSSLFSRLGAAHVALAFVTLATLLLLIPGLAIPTITKVFVDDVLIHRSGSWVAPLLIGLAVTAVLRGMLTWLQQMCFALMETKLALVTTARFFFHVLTLPMAFFGQRYAGDIAQRVASNDTVARLITSELTTNAINVLTMVFYLAVMLAYDLLLTLVAVVLVMLNLLALRLVSRVRDQASRGMLKEQGKVAGASVNGVQMIESLKASGGEQDFFARWTGMHANALAAQHQLGLYTGLLNVVPPFLSALTTVAILGAGGVRILEGALTIGGLVAFQSLAQSFSQPIEGLVRFGGELQTVKADIARLDDVLKYEPEPRAARGMDVVSPPPAEPARGVVVLEGVSFGYNPQEPPLIEDLSLAIEPGQRVALVGGSGSGKSTVAKLICGLLTPWSGTVRVDGCALDEVPPAQFREMVSYVDQSIVLFEGSVRDNVTLWDRSIDDREVTRALRDATIHDAIMARRGKYDAMVEENGRNFSGGQRQRLEIARALALDPAILVLDEATAALDPVTELAIDDSLRRRGCTCLIVAHRVSTVRDADEIVVLDGGRIVQRGVHDSLVAQEGPYRTLVTTD